MNKPDNKCPTNPLESDSEFQMTMMNPNPSFQTHKDGDKYFIKWEYSKEEWEWFTDPNINRTGMVVESVGMVTHRNTKNISGSANGRPFAFDADNVGSSPTPETKQKGWKLSQEAGKLCGDLSFQLFLQAYNKEKWAYMNDVGIKDPHLKAAQVVRDNCNINSRRELDTNAEARHIFMNIMTEYGDWSKKILVPE